MLCLMKTEEIAQVMDSGLPILGQKEENHFFYEELPLLPEEVMKVGYLFLPSPDFRIQEFRAVYRMGEEK